MDRDYSSFLEKKNIVVIDNFSSLQMERRNVNGKEEEAKEDGEWIYYSTMEFHSLKFLDLMSYVKFYYLLYFIKNCGSLCKFLKYRNYILFEFCITNFVKNIQYFIDQLQFSSSHNSRKNFVQKQINRFYTFSPPVISGKIPRFLRQIPILLFNPIRYSKDLSLDKLTTIQLFFAIT